MKETLCALMAAAVILTGGCRNRTSEISDERTPKMSVLHVIDVKQFMVSETEQYDLMIAIASIEGLLARNSEGPGVYLIESEKYDWVEEISEDAAEVKDWGGDWHGFLGELLPVIPHRYVAMDDFSIEVGNLILRCSAVGIEHLELQLHRIAGMGNSAEG